jgi:hypothetical protein
MFQLVNQQAKIKSVTLRTEKNGPNKEVPAITIRFVFKAVMKTLSTIDETLPKLLFRKPGKDEVIKGALPPQENLPGVPAAEENTTELTARKYKQVPSIPWEEKFTNYHLDIGSGLESTQPLECDGVSVSSFNITPLDGGFAEIEMNCGFLIDEETAGKLAMMQKHTVEITLVPPSDE